MPGEKWKRSLQNPKQYEAIKKAEMAKGTSEAAAQRKAAKISNARSPGHKVPKRR